jgi:hypothetical protein
MDEPRRKRGRPTVGKRVPLGLRVTPELKKRLDAAAEQSGRSQSQEAEFRLERSFDRGDLLAEVLSLHYGNELAGILMLLGGAMDVAYCVHPITRSWTWAAHPVDYDEAVQAAVAILEALRPRELPASGDRAWPTLPSGIGVKIAKRLIKEVRGDSDTTEPDAEERARIRSLLGPIAARLSDRKQGGADEGEHNSSGTKKLAAKVRRRAK